MTGLVPLTKMAGHLDGNEKAVLFRKAGPEGVEVVGNLLGNRARIGLAFGMDRAVALEEISRRIRTKQPVVEIASDAAPVHEVVLTGDQADLTSLPVHLQHEMDGDPIFPPALITRAIPIRATPMRVSAA